MHQATLFFDTVIGKKGGLGWSSEDAARRRQLLRLAALCHDVGHTPFSHAGEVGGLILARHEDYSAAIVTATTRHASEIRQVLTAREEELLGITPEQVAELISGKAVGLEGLLYEMMSGELDADRTDYLQRDSLYCGVQYGRFDSERLVSTLTWTEEPIGGNPVLAIERDGINAAEGLILARYFMFTQVYFHRVRRAYDYHLGEAISAVVGQYPDLDDLDEYLAWDDVRVFTLLRELAASNDPGSDHARRILERNHFRVAYQTAEHPSAAVLRRWDQLCKLAKAKFGDQVAFDSAQKAPHRFDKALQGFPVLKDAGERPTSVEEESSLIEKLEELRVCRILAPKELVDEVKSFCDERNLNVN